MNNPNIVTNVALNVMEAELLIELATTHFNKVLATNPKDESLPMLRALLTRLKKAW